MGTITLPNFRTTADVTMNTRLKDGGVAIDWAGLTNIKAWLYSDAQKAIAGRCDVSIDQTDSTKLVCEYSANKPQYLGVQRLIVQAKYMGRTKTYDKPVFNFVPRTADQEGEEITIDDPDVDVEIDVEDVSSSILQEAVDAAFSAADRANEAAAAAEHMVDIHTGPEGKSAYEVAVEEGYTGTEEEWLASLKGPVGETPDISIGTVTTVEPGTPAAATMTGTPEDPVLNLTIPKGAVGATPNFTVGTVTTGDPGTPVVVTITGTPDAPVLNVTIPQGMQGNTGSSVEYPYELVNNLTTNDATKGLSAAQGYVLDGKVSQLEAEVHNLSGKYYGVFTSANDLPEGDANGYAFVGTEEPFEIYNCVGGEWEDSGAQAVGIQGPQGNSGYTGAAGELEVVNNLVDGGPTAALSAEAGKLLARNMKLLYDSMGAAAFWGVKPDIDWSGNSVPVSLSLSNCSSSNIASYVALGDPYYTEITPDSGSILASVSCTMNGEVVPVVNGVINIAQVTGAILITAVGANLDTIAYDGKTYKQIFETYNTLGISPGFDNGSYSPLTVGAGSPSITTEDADTGQYSLKCSGTSSQQVRTSGSFGDKGFVACRVKVTSWTAGYCGAQYNSINAGANYVTDGWETKVIHRGNTSPTSAVFVGSYSSANLTGYVDSPVFVKDSVFTTVPTTEKFTQLYNEYIAIKKAS